MKKNILFISLIFTTFILTAQTFQIVDVNYNIVGSKGISFGKTNPISLEFKCPVDTKTVFESEEQFNKYIAEYKQQLNNLRAFNTVDVSYTNNYNEEENSNNVILQVNLVDSSHLLALPYPKYDSNTGFNLKIKAKDTNFLGTLNPLAADLYVNWKEDINKWAVGFNFSYDYPFKAGIFNATWDNDLNMDYVFGEKNPTFKTTIGVGFSYPRSLFAINFGAYQTIGFAKPSNFAKDNYFYFQEHFGVKTPINLYKAENFSTVTYTPYADFMFSWDLNDIKNMTPIKDGISLNFGHSISNSKINWNNYFRKGYGLSLNNDFTYKFNTDFPIPTVSLEGKLYYNFKIMDKSFLDRFGINSRLYAFTVIEIPERNKNGNFEIGKRMRGILDDKIPGTSYGAVFNLDIPVNIITTNFKYDFLNFTMQMSPFIDVALLNNDTLNNFNLNKKYLTTGMEVLVYPHKFKGYTIRASLGFDLLEAFKSQNKFKGLLNNKEIYVGLDVHY